MTQQRRREAEGAVSHHPSSRIPAGITVTVTQPGVPLPTVTLSCREGMLLRQSQVQSFLGERCHNKSLWYTDRVKTFGTQWEEKVMLADCKATAGTIKLETDNLSRCFCSGLPHKVQCGKLSLRRESYCHICPMSSQGSITHHRRNGESYVCRRQQRTD